MRHTNGGGSDAKPRRVEVVTACELIYEDGKLFYSFTSMRQPLSIAKAAEIRNFLSSAMNEMRRVENA